MWYSNFATPNLMEVVYKVQYSISLIWFYSIIFFVLFYRSKNISKKILYTIFAWYFVSIALLNFTDLFLWSVDFSLDEGKYVENYGPLYSLLVGAYILIFPLFFLISWFKIRRLSYLDKSRLNIIIVGFILLIGLPLIFQVIIPFFSQDAAKISWDFILPFFMLPFILWIIYASRKYDFTSMKIYIFEILSLILSFVIATLSVILLKAICIWFGYNQIDLYEFSIPEILILIILFLAIFKKISSKNTQDSFSETFMQIYQELPSLTHQRELSQFVSDILSEKHKIQGSYISVDIPELICKYFSWKKHKNFILNDYVFLDEMAWGLWEIIDQGQLFEKNTGIIFPIYSFQQDLIAILIVWKKPFSDPFLSHEIAEFLRFTNILRYHFAYIKSYKKNQEMSIYLDKKVDEKTIEYNTLLTKQKDFIRYLAHEIRNLLTNAIFLADSLQEKYQEEDTHILYDELWKIWGLVKNIFTTEQFDLEKIKILKHRTSMNTFLWEICASFETAHPDVFFDMSIEHNLWEKKIDEIQLRQVMYNLLWNAIKFADISSPKISITAKKYEIDEIFEKYSSGDGNGVGLGLGLFLCKKIVDLHSWTIHVRNVDIYGGAEFCIII